YIPPTIKNPEDPSEDTPVPYVPAGTVTVHYVDEKGNPIKDPTVDTPTSPVDTDYNTNENGTEIPKEVKGKDGKDYVLVKVKDGDKEIGKVVKGNTDVTYIYKVKETPEKPDPNDPQGPKDPEGPKDPQSPKDPEGPKDPQSPKDPEGPKEPQSPKDPEGPNDPQGPKDPEGPNDPQEPNVPEKPGNPEDPSMPEAPKEKPTPEKPAEPGQPTPEQPGQNKGEVKKSAVLPNTGEASTMIGWSAAALSILAGLGLVATGRKKEDEEA
ncbi:MucBP domain-containing protein, partial [Aerococcaceae bacterium zg-BR22]|uniref:MucBP domain-containing protein n=1 Tax=Aerococcaceae bacterium zg-1292 TaxID=2774330 RepID=UPI004063EE73|nr:MucBP domain-containing protein [Aerococcaceae bacterium zg-BR22]